MSHHCLPEKGLPLGLPWGRCEDLQDLPARIGEPGKTGGLVGQVTEKTINKDLAHGEEGKDGDLLGGKGHVSLTGSTF